MVIDAYVEIGDRAMITYDSVYDMENPLNLTNVIGVITKIERKNDGEYEDSFMFKHTNYRGEIKSVRIRGNDKFVAIPSQTIDW